MTIQTRTTTMRLARGITPRRAARIITPLAVGAALSHIATFTSAILVLAAIGIGATTGTYAVAGAGLGTWGLTLLATTLPHAVLHAVAPLEGQVDAVDRMVRWRSGG